MNPQTREDRLAELVAAGLELIERGERPDVISLCGGDTALAAPVAAAIGLAAALPDLHEQAWTVDARVGQVLCGRYRLDERIGAGAMGAVYRSTDLELGREVAVKVLAGDRVNGERAVQRFLREAEACAAIESDHVVRVHDRGQTGDGTLFVVLELLRGASLATINAWIEDDGLRAAARAPVDGLEARLGVALRERDLLRQAVRWCAEIADGLAAAHAIGVIHRDVKPSNVFVDSRSGRALVLDFGIAARAEDGALTAAGSILGTPWYLPPEVVERGTTADPRLDVYGVAATLYHLLAAAPPYAGDGPEVLARVQREDPIPLARRTQGLPRDLIAIVEQGMAREPRHRYPDVRALGDDLRAFLEHRPVRARPLAGWQRTWRRIRRRPAVAAAVALGVIATLALAIAVPIWTELARVQADARYDEIVRHLPALLTIEGHPEQRLLIGDEDSAIHLGALDEALALRPDDDSLRLLRAAVHLDAGRPEQARADLQALVEHAGTPFVRAVGARYAALPADARGIAALDLAGLPEPVTATDHFVAGFHQLRLRTPEAVAQALVDLDAAGELVFARDLRLIALLGNGRWVDALHAARELEVRYGAPTARTRHTIAAALGALRRYDEALPVCDDAVAMRPDRHGPLNNRGLVLMRLGRFDEAQRDLEAAHRLRPYLWNTSDLLSQLHCRLGAFDTAREWAMRIPETGPAGESWRRPRAIGNVELQRAFDALGRGDPAAARLAGRDAMRWLQEAMRAATPADRNEIRNAEILASWIATGQTGKRLRDLVNLALATPTDPEALRNIAAVLEGELREGEVAAMRALLLEIAAALTPGSPLYRESADRARAAADLSKRRDR